MVMEFIGAGKIPEFLVPQMKAAISKEFTKFENLYKSHCYLRA